MVMLEPPVICKVGGTTFFLRSAQGRFALGGSVSSLHVLLLNKSEVISFSFSDVHLYARTPLVLE